MSATRTQRGWLKPSEVLALSAKVRAIWTAQPELTINQVIAMTEAPKYVIANVRKRLLKAGVLTSRGW